MERRAGPGRRGGAPSIGLYAVAAARALGASEVVYVDAGEERARVAEALGARAVVERARADSRLGRFPVTVDASATAEGLGLALASTDVEGTCTSVGIYLGDVALPLFELYTRGVRFVTGRVNARAELPGVLAALAERTLRIESVVTARAGWDEAADAWLAPATKLVVARQVSA
ncbi:MAG: zinc-binding dehydrogenase [Sandaracinaceae bacterium]|nr:zinc-binding dehydrogenase [Sandaracinaceae bacterium]